MPSLTPSCPPDLFNFPSLYRHTVLLPGQCARWTSCLQTLFPSTQPLPTRCFPLGLLILQGEAILEILPEPAPWTWRKWPTMLSDRELHLSVGVGGGAIASVVLALLVLGSYDRRLSGSYVRTQSSSSWRQKPVTVPGMTVAAGASHPARGSELSGQV